MNKQIPFLKPGDLIEIVAPAKSIEAEYVHYAKAVLEEKGFIVRISDNCLGQYNYFSGTLADRIHDFQQALDNTNVRAILCARGGYGSVQIIDKLDWQTFHSSPKWIVGFSDITVFHQKLQRDNYSSVHATMPLNFKENSQEAIDTLIAALTGKEYSIHGPVSAYNRAGNANSEIVGGNLSILYSKIGTDNQPDYEGKILFIEDLSEQIYHLDRMFYAFKKAGILEKIKGLIVGGMTDMKDTQIPYGNSFQEVILSHVEQLGIPVCFDFPAGHIDDNRALVFGERVEFSVNELGSSVFFTEQRSSL